MAAMPLGIPRVFGEVYMSIRMLEKILDIWFGENEIAALFNGGMNE
jgi:hypothetical protein